MRIRSWLLVVAMLLVATVAYAALTTQHVIGTTTLNLLTTELNNIPGNGFTPVGPVQNNTLSGTTTGAGYRECRIEGFFTFNAIPADNGAVGVWFLKSTDGGTNYENVSTSSVRLGRPYDVILPVTGGQTSTRVSVDTRCPAGFFRALARNDATLQALTASGHTIKAQMITPQLN